MGGDQPRFANEAALSFSSCMAGSSDMISPLGSYLFQQPQWGQRKARVSMGGGCGTERQ